MCARPRLDALLASTYQVRGDSKPLQVFQPEALLDVRGRQVPERLPPRLALERRPALVDQAHGDSLPHSG